MNSFWFSVYAVAVLVGYTQVHITLYLVRSNALDYNSHNDLTADLKIPMRLIFVCCHDLPGGTDEYNFEFGEGYNKGISRFVPRYNDSNVDHDCNSPMPSGEWARQSFLKRVHEEINGAGGKYMVSQLATCDDDEETWNIAIDSMLQGEDSVSAATKMRYALQDKDKLYKIFTRLGLSAYVPKQYDFPKELPGQYPVILKRTQGMWGHGVHIVTSKEELNGMLQDDGQLQEGDIERQAGVGYVVQEALVNTTEHVLHYVHTPKGFPGHGWTKVWCGVYSHSDWVDKKGLFIKGYSYKDSYPDLTRTQCDNTAVQVALAVMKGVGVSGFGCLNYKYVEDTPKIFDWNVRHCGSQNPHIIKELMGELPEKLEYPKY